MQTIDIIPVQTDMQLKEVTDLAAQIWQEHFTPIIGAEQVAYMVKKFQSFEAVSAQLADGFEYYMLCLDNTLAGYMGIHQEVDRMFLSKLYIEKSFRGKKIGRQAIAFLIETCKNRKLPNIYLTCNRYNTNTLTAYAHLGFGITKEQVADIGNNYIMDDYILEYEVPVE